MNTPEPPPSDSFPQRAKTDQTSHSSVSDPVATAGRVIKNLFLKSVLFSAVSFLFLIGFALYLSAGVSSNDEVFQKVRTGMTRERVKEILQPVPFREGVVRNAAGEEVKYLSWEVPTLLFGISYQIEFDTADRVCETRRQD